MHALIVRQKYKLTLLILFFAITIICRGENLRFSAIVQVAEEHTQLMTIETDDGEEKLFVKNESIITDKDIKKVWMDPVHDGMMRVTLTKDGLEKFAIPTSMMRHGIDRIAVVVGDKLISILTVHQPPIGRFMVITGLKDFELNREDDLATKFTGLPPKAVVSPPPPDL